MNVLQALATMHNNSLYENTYRSVAGGILANLNEMKDATMYDVANLTASSRSTVLRMIQMLGYSSYSEFHSALKQAINQYHHYNRLFPQNVCYSSESIAAFASSRYYQAYEQAKGVITGAKVEKFAKLIHEADRVSEYLHYSMGSATSLSINLAISGKKHDLCMIYADMLKNAEELSETSLVIGATIEYSETLNMEPVFKLAKERGATIIIGTETSKYARYADHFFMSKEEMAKYGSPVSSVFDQFLICVSEAYRTKYID